MNRIPRPARIGLVVGALLALAIAIPAMAVTLLRGSVTANGGTPSAGSSAAGKILYGTAGQAVVGISGNALNNLCHGFWCFGGVRVVSVDDLPGGGAPKTLDFGRPFPNPAFDHVGLTLALPRTADVRVNVFGDPLNSRKASF